MMEPMEMEWDNEGFDKDMPVEKGVLSTDTAFDSVRVDETNAGTGFGEVHAERGATGEEIDELAQTDTSILSVGPRAVNPELLTEEELIDKKDKFIDKYMKDNSLQLKNEDRNELYSKLRIDGAHMYYSDNAHDFRLTKENHEPYAQGSINKAGASKFKRYFKDAAGDTPKTAVGGARPKTKGFIDRLKNAADKPEEIGLKTIAENEPETGFAESSFGLRNRSVSVEPTMADQQRIFEALRDVDIVEFVQENRSNIDIQLHNASKLKFKLKNAEADLRSVKKHKDLEWIKAAKKEIESIELHLKSIAGKLARLYADKFYDSSLTWPTRLRYMFKLKGFKIGVIVSAIGITFSAIVAGLIETFTPAAKAAGNAAAGAIKTIGPTVNNLFETVKAGMWKIVLWAIGTVASVVEVIFGYLAKYIIILLAW